MRYLVVAVAILFGCTEENFDFRPDGAVGDAAPDAAATPDEGRSDGAIPDGAPPDMPPDGPPGGECQDGDTQTEACGLNDRGERARRCEGGTWGPFGGCADDDECVDGSQEVRDCPEGGEQSRACEAGVWKAWSECGAPPDCAPGDTQDRACGLNGRGRETRSCAEDGWGAWSECADDDVCIDGDTVVEACGLNGRGEAVQPCADGQWAPIGPCADPDECADGAEELRDCQDGPDGVERRICVLGSWTGWQMCEVGGECEPGMEERRDCGFNGRGDQSRVCAEGQWAPWSRCDDPDVCADGMAEVRPCGFNDRGEETRRCVDGQWAQWMCADPDQCVDGDQEERACGLNGRGTQVRPCQDGDWRPWRACDDPDLCADEDVQVQQCDNGGERQRRCGDGQWGPWSDCDVECQEGAEETEPCAGGGQRSRVCVDGRFGDWGPCLDPDLDACEAPQHVVDGLENGARYAFDTRERDDRYRASCAGEARSGEGVMVLTLNAAVDLVLEIVEADYDTALYIRTNCRDARSEIDCNDDIVRGRETRSRITRRFEPGTYYVFVDGFGEGENGTSVLQLRADVPAECQDGQEDVRCSEDGQREVRTCENGQWGEWIDCAVIGIDLCFGVVCPGDDVCVDRFERNDSPQSATPIEPAQYDDLSLCAGADEDDWFAVDLARPSLLHVELEYDGDAPGLALSQPGEPPLNVALVEVGNRVRAQTFTRDGGVHLIRALGRNFRATRYALLVEVDSPAMCEWAPEPCADCTDRFDPNEVAEDAPELPLNRWHEGLSLCANLDPEDHYRLDFGDDGEARVRVAAQANSAGIISATLFGPNGEALQPFSTQVEGGLRDFRYRLRAGEYVLRVFGYQAAGVYNLRVDAPDD